MASGQTESAHSLVTGQAGDGAKPPPANLTAPEEWVRLG
jgi:hypothetical protein